MYLRPQIFVEEARLDTLEIVVKAAWNLDWAGQDWSTFQVATLRTDFDLELESKAESWVRELRDGK